MNKWVALIIGMLIVILGCVVAGEIGSESRIAALLVFFVGHLLALVVFIIFLRKHTPALLAGIMFQVIIILGLLVSTDAPPVPSERAMADPPPVRIEIVPRDTTDE